MTDDEARVRGPRAVTRVVDLFHLLSRHRDGMSLAQLSAGMKVAKPTLLDTLRGLCDLHYLTHADGRYRLGTGTYRLAGKIIAAFSPPEALRQEVKDLAERTRESVGFAIADWELGYAVYTEAISSTRPVRYAMHQGIRAPLYASAAGRVILAYADADLVDGYLTRTPLKLMTAKTRVTGEDIRRHLSEIRACGFCASFGEMLPETAAVAAPVFDHGGEITGAMMLAAPIDRMREHADSYRAAVVEACRKASHT